MKQDALEEPPPTRHLLSFMSLNPKPYTQVEEHSNEAGRPRKGSQRGIFSAS
jgi:hypothetical protein